MEANCLAVWKIGDLQAVDIYQYTISFMFEDKTKHQTWLLILNILRQISLNFQYYWKNMKLLSKGENIIPIIQLEGSWHLEFPRVCIFCPSVVVDC